MPPRAGPAPTVTVSTVEAAPTPSAQPERAQWVLLPPLAWSPTFQRTTDDGTLYAGPGNERWLVHARMPPRGTGPDPVALAGVLHSETGLAFITPAGAVYSARSPLGALTLVTAPSQAYVDAAAGRDHFLAIDATGSLLRSADRGQSWQAVSVPPHGGAFSEVEMLQSGAGLLLASHAGKGQLFSTRDDGATWRKVESGGRTFTRLLSNENELRPVVSVNREQDYYVYAILDDTLARVTEESRGFDALAPFAHPTAVPPDVAMFLDARDAAPGVPARPLRWLALRDPNSGPPAFEISITPFGELPNYRTVEGSMGCKLGRAVLVSGIAAVCWEHTVKASLLVGDDNGLDFRKFPLPREPRTLDALGDALVVQAPCDGPKHARGPFLLEPPTWKARPVHDALPLGERTCRTHLAFISAAEPGTFFSVAWANSELTLHRWHAGDPTPELVSTIAAAPSEPSTRVSIAREGTTVVVAVPTPSVWPPVNPDTLPPSLLFRSDDAGQHFSESALPTAFMALGLSGRRGFGVNYGGQGFMTHDFGATWTNVWAPRNASWRTIECGDAGCLTARGLRIGWAP